MTDTCAAIDVVLPELFVTVTVYDPLLKVEADVTV